MYLLTDSTNPAFALAAVLLCAALLHASFQLSASVMTLLSGHALGSKQSHSRLLRLCGGYIIGNAVIIGLLVTAATYKVSSLTSGLSISWAAVSVLGILAGLAALLFYYPKKDNRLWIPRSAAEYLIERSKKTKRTFEAVALGMMTGIAELPFIAAPLFFAAMVLRGTPDADRLFTVGLYTVIACLPLIALFVAIGSGKPVSQLERWRQDNRGFLQLVSGIGLVVLSGYIFVTYYWSQLGAVV